MRVLVTGGSGRIGTAIIRELVAHGHEAVNADRRAPAERLAPYRETDLGDVGQVLGALHGCEAVIHMGAIPAPNGHADEVVFGNNTRATFAVLQAASLLGVRKAVFASSISALGTAFAPTAVSPLYAPVDEDHPLLGQDAYALSKEVDERTAEMFHRRTGMQVLAYRFHWVTTAEDAAAYAADPTPKLDSWTRLLWGYVDVRDAATACRLGVEVDGLGFEVFNIMAADTLSSEPTEALLRRHVPQVEIRGSLPGRTSAFSSEKARRLLGYEARHSWRE